MNKTTTFIAPAQYVSPVCKTIMLNAEAHYLQHLSPSDINDVFETEYGEY